MYTLFLGQESHSTSYAKLYSFQVEGVKADTHSLTYKVAYRNQAVRVLSARSIEGSQCSGNFLYVIYDLPSVKTDL